MKKAAVLLICTLLSVAVTGQTIKKPIGLQAPIWGVKGGINIATLGGKDLDWVERIDFNVGVAAEWELSPAPLSFTAELLYSREGARTGEIGIWEGNTLYTNGEETVLRLSYIELPVGLKWFWGNTSLDFGAQYGYLAGASGYFYGDNNRTPGVNVSGEFVRLPRTQFKPSVWSLWAGMTVNYTHFSYGFRIVQGLTRALEYDKGSVSTNIQFSIGYVF